MERDTVGKLSAELLQKDDNPDVTAGERMQEQLGEYEQLLLEAASRGKIEYADDFFIVATTRLYKYMPNALHMQFWPRVSCPTPHLDQIVYKYHRKDERIEFLWTIPDKDACKDLKLNAMNLDPSFKELLQFVLDFEDGTLDKKAMDLNGEIV